MENIRRVEKGAYELGLGKAHFAEDYGDMQACQPKPEGILGKIPEVLSDGAVSEMSSSKRADSTRRNDG